MIRKGVILMLCIAMYQAAAAVLCDEAKAGHYVVKNTGILYHSGANFGYKNVQYTDKIMEFWYDSMIDGFKSDLAADKVHLQQVGYNACGLLLGENLYNYFRKNVKLESLEIRDETGATIEEELLLDRVGTTRKLYALAEPCYVSDFTIELSENLELLSPFAVRAKAKGEGFIKITKDGQTVRQITVQVGK